MMVFTISWFHFVEIKHAEAEFAAKLDFCGMLKETRNMQHNLQTSDGSQAQCHRCHNKFSDDEFFSSFGGKR